MILKVYIGVALGILATGSVIAGFQYVLNRYSSPLGTICTSALIALLWPLAVVVAPPLLVGHLIGTAIQAYLLMKRNTKAGNEPKW